MTWTEDFDDYHDRGKSGCPACVTTSEPCVCGGVIHNQLEQEDLQELQKMCDVCHEHFSVVKEQVCAG